MPFKSILNRSGSNASEEDGEPEMRRNVEAILRPSESLILLTDTDITSEGGYGRRWLAVTSQRLMTFPDGGGKPDAGFALEEIEKVTPVNLVGQMALEAESEGRKVELLRCSNSLSSRFARVAKSLNEAHKEERPPEFDLEEEETHICPNCGRLLPEKGSFCPACLKKTRVLARFWKYLSPHWPKLALVSVLIVVTTAINLVPPYMIKILVDDVLQGEGGTDLLLLLVLGLAGLRVASMGAGISRGRVTAWLGAQIVHELRFDLYQSIQSLSLRRYDKTQTGSLMARLTSDTQRLNWFFIDVGTFFVPNLLQLVGICLVLFLMDWRLALLVLVPTPAVVLLTMWFYRRLHSLYHGLWQRSAKMRSTAQDTISGIRVVKAFTQEPEEIDRFGDKSLDVYRASGTAESTWATSYPLISFLTMSGSLLLWYFGGMRVIGEQISLGELMAFFGYIGMFYGPIQMLTRMTDWINRAFTSAQRLFEITDADQEVYEDPDAQPLDDPEGAFGFEDVHFGYVKDKPVLKGMDVEVEPGEMIGLVGKSGVGKTTMINLICRFYDVDEGRITLDGTDIRDIRLRDLRRHIGIVPQESFLFNGTIAENIRYANPDADRDDVIDAAIAANAHGFIMRFPDGYDTRVGERGARLSGGEKQRISIARAILHDPKILILDEATSLVDTETESLIQEALARLVKNRTTFAIAHRLSTLKNASRLLVIEDGKRAEFGTHVELLAKEGTYHKLVQMQSKLSAIKAVDG
jgi:ATP-binding cassette subfamily B protein